MRAEIAPTSGGRTLFVSPAGQGSAVGTQEAPLDSLQAAVNQLDPVKGGTVLLLSGTYAHGVKISELATKEASPGLLTIKAAPGAEVTFDGADSLAKAVRVSEKIPVYEAKVEATLNTPPDLWEDSTRRRYRAVLDAEAVDAYPGTFALIDAHTLRFHATEDRTPADLDVRVSGLRDAGFTFSRPNVRLEGLTFRNFLNGGKWGGAVFLRANDMVVSHCEFVHAMKAVQIFFPSTGSIVEDCRFSDVSCGVFSEGIDPVIRRCVFSSVPENFKPEAYGQDATAIQFYTPADGGTVSECTSYGFRKGLFIKGTGTRRAYTFSHNTFPDGVEQGGGSGVPQMAAVSYLSNIIGVEDWQRNTAQNMADTKSRWASNYFFTPGAKNRAVEPIALLPERNVVGPDPLVHSSEGSLTLASNIPELQNGAIGAPAKQLQGLKLASLPQTEVVSSEPLTLKEQPQVTASENGALIVARGTQPSSATLWWRQTGQSDWQKANELQGGSTQCDMGEVKIGQAQVSRDHRFFLSATKLEPSHAYEARVILGPEEKVASETFSFHTEGKGKTICVSPAGSDATATGEPGQPFGSLQAALDHTLPGDTLKLQPGLYRGSAALLYGGTAEHPITIKGASSANTILDGAKLTDYILKLSNCRNVTISGLFIRWFKTNGIDATICSNLTIRDCRFQNFFFYWWPTGNAILLKDSPRVTISNCILTRCEYGVLAADSPQLSLLNNTAFGNLYGGAWLIRSSKNSIVTGNSFTYTGNQSLRIYEPDAADFASLKCDENNFGTTIRTVSPPTVRPEADFRPSPQYPGAVGLSKYTIVFNQNGPDRQFIRMEDWKKYSGKDQHSIFADPGYVDPLHGDYSLLPNSPNIITQPNGSVLTIGAVESKGH